MDEYRLLLLLPVCDASGYSIGRRARDKIEVNDLFLFITFHKVCYDCAVDRFFRSFVEPGS